MSHINQESPVARVGGLLLGITAMLFALMTLMAVLSDPAGAASPIRVATACAPLTTSQLAQPGDAQTCRVRVQNWSGSNQDVTIAHDSHFTLTSATVCFGASCSGAVPYTGQAITLGNYGQATVIYQYVRGGPYEDGLGLTHGCATIVGGQRYCSTEQKSLP